MLLQAMWLAGAVQAAVRNTKPSTPSKRHAKRLQQVRAHTSARSTGRVLASALACADSAAQHAGRCAASPDGAAFGAKACTLADALQLPPFPSCMRPSTPLPLSSVALHAGVLTLAGSGPCTSPSAARVANLALALRAGDTDATPECCEAAGDALFE